MAFPSKLPITHYLVGTGAPTGDQNIPAGYCYVNRTNGDLYIYTEDDGWDRVAQAGYPQTPIYNNGRTHVILDSNPFPALGYTSVPDQFASSGLFAESEGGANTAVDLSVNDPIGASIFLTTGDQFDGTSLGLFSKLIQDSDYAGALVPISGPVSLGTDARRLESLQLTDGKPASLTTGTVNDRVRWVVSTGGEFTNNYQVAYVDPGAPSQSLSAVCTIPLLTINLATDADGVITTTAADIIALGSNPDAAPFTPFSDGVGTRAGVVSAMGATNLVGGTNAVSAQGAVSAVQNVPAGTDTGHNLSVNENLGPNTASLTVLINDEGLNIAAVVASVTDTDGTTILATKGKSVYIDDIMGYTGDILPTDTVHVLKGIITGVN